VIQLIYDTSVTFISASIPNISGIAGAVVASALTKKCGRKPILVYTLLPVITAWLLFSFGQTFPKFVVAGLLQGLATGITAVVGQLYLIETATTKTRGFITGTTLLWIAFYNLVNYVLGAFVSWKSLALINCAIHVVYLIFTWAVVPESPKWLAGQGRFEEAEKGWKFLKMSSNQRSVNEYKLVTSIHFHNSFTTRYFCQ
jgi:SP family facilitated glucose transporter-like MFS transporter 8